MAVTIYDLAREAHVSIATVSKALNNSYTISDKTRERIQTLARQMNYQPNARARSFARQRNGTVLFAANLARGVAFEDPHLFEIINGVERRLDEKGYSLLIKHVPPEDAPERICSLMQSEQADGVMLHAGILTRSLASVLIREEMPHLVVGKPSFPCSVCWMDVSHEAAGQLAANYLLDKGYRRITFLLDTEGEGKIAQRRLDGLNAALEEEDLTIESIPGVNGYEDSYRQTAELLKRPELPEVILCANNYLAIGCLQMLRQQGIRIPEDMALMTFDNYPFSMLLKPQLTAIEVDMFELGWEAAHFMLQKLHKPNLQTQSFCTFPTLVEREST